MYIIIHYKRNDPDLFNRTIHYLDCCMCRMKASEDKQTIVIDFIGKHQMSYTKTPLFITGLISYCGWQSTDFTVEAVKYSTVPVVYEFGTGQFPNMYKVYKAKNDTSPVCWTPL